ncbi:MAG: hypothetical protein U5R31_02450 [Acidimicrobiia bacterium]|nr:hypothetical protein [Acidimicrobiia bacterium]
MAALADLTGEDPTAHLDRLGAEGLVRWEQHRPLVAHDLIADGVRWSTPPDELRRLHGAAAARAESRHPVDGAALAEVGHHRLAALPNEPDAAVEACLAAGNEALATAVPDEAAIWFERARSVVDGLGSAPRAGSGRRAGRGERRSCASDSPSGPAPPPPGGPSGSGARGRSGPGPSGLALHGRSHPPPGRGSRVLRPPRGSRRRTR